MTDFPTLSYTWRLKRVPFRASPYRPFYGVPPVPPSDMPLPPVASLPTFLLLTKFTYTTKKNTNGRSRCTAVSSPQKNRRGRGALHSRKRTYKQGFVALVLAFLNFCWARDVNYKLSYFYLALLYSSCVRLQSEVIILIFQSTLWFFGSSLNGQKLARPRPFNTRNNSSWIYCSDNLINFLFETNFRLLESPSSLFSFQFYWSIGDGPSFHSSPCNQNIGCPSCIRVSEYRKW